MKCKKSNHFAKMCKNENVHALEGETSSGNSFVIDTIEIDALDTCWYEIIELLDCNKRVKFKLDTGAQVYVIPEYVFQFLKLNNELKKNKYANLELLRSEARS